MKQKKQHRDRNTQELARATMAPMPDKLLKGWLVTHKLSLAANGTVYSTIGLQHGEDKHRYPWVALAWAVTLERFVAGLTVEDKRASWLKRFDNEGMLELPPGSPWRLMLRRKPKEVRYE